MMLHAGLANPTCLNKGFQVWYSVCELEFKEELWCLWEDRHILYTVLKPDSNRSQSRLDTGCLRCHSKEKPGHEYKPGRGLRSPPATCHIRVEMATACAKDEKRVCSFFFKLKAVEYVRDYFSQHLPARSRLDTLPG